MFNLRQLLARWLRGKVKQARGQSLTLHTHVNVRYKGVSYGFLQMPADQCIREGVCQKERYHYG